MLMAIEEGIPIVYDTCYCLMLESGDKNEELGLENNRFSNSAFMVTGVARYDD